MVTENRKKDAIRQAKGKERQERKMRQQSKAFCYECKRNPSLEMQLAPRRQRYIPPTKTLVLVYEGKKTEPQYFESLNNYLRLLSIKLIEIKAAGDPLGVVNRAREIKQSNVNHGDVWAVFDRDSFSIDRINAALNIAKSSNIHVAFSNEAFEIWYLLHYKLEYTPRNRTEYSAEISAAIGKKYEKNDPDIFSIISERTIVALNHAITLEKKYNDTQNIPLHDRNPYTTVHKLVSAFFNVPFFLIEKAPKPVVEIYNALRTLQLIENQVN